MRAQESYNQKDVAAGTYGPILLDGGRYRLSAKSTWGGGNLVLQQLLPDGSTFFTLFGRPSDATPTTWVGSLLADGVVDFLDLPPGTYQVVITTAIANYFSLTRVPLE